MGSARTFSLEQIRADGWFQRLGEDADQFSALCDAVGETVVAFTVIAGVRIAAVEIDPRFRDASRITFTLNDAPEEHQLPLGEMRRRLAATLAAEEPEPEALPEHPNAADLQSYLGFRTVLLAPFFGFSLLELTVEEGERDRIKIELDGEEDEVTLDELRRLLQSEVMRSARGHQGQRPFSLELDRVDLAEEAIESGDYEKVIELIGTWPGPLSVLFRTEERTTLKEEPRKAIVRALSALGQAYGALGNQEWAEDVFRLGIQWGQAIGGPVQGQICVALANLQREDGRFPHAIGLYRRALALGVERDEVLASMAECYFKSEKLLPGLLCATEASSLSEEVDTSAKKAAEELGEAWTAFLELTG